MATRGSAYCPVCQSQRLTQRESANNIFHLLMTVMTGGLWLLVWFVKGTAPSTGQWRCTVCGTVLAQGILERAVSLPALERERAQGDHDAVRNWLDHLEQLRRDGKVDEERYAQLRADALRDN